MGWEQRGNNLYYYRKEREGSRVKSTYVGRGEIAHLISQFQASSTAVERITRANSDNQSKEAEAALELATDPVQLVTKSALLTPAFTLQEAMEAYTQCKTLMVLLQLRPEQVRAEFKVFLDKTNKENPHTKDVTDLSNLLSDNRRLELWRDVASAGYLAELMVIENAHATAALKECWKHRFR